jgi:ribosome-associated toxin RatA of RatAB toxin-antitoxin module
MATVIVSKRVNAPVEAVWESWNDFAGIDKFHPLLKKSYLLTDESKPTRVGARRQCDLSDNKNWLREEIIDHQPNKLLKIDIYESSMPVKSMQATIEFEKISEERTRVRFSSEFQPGMGILGKLMVPMMKRQFAPMLQALLDGNAAYVERQQTVAEAA